MFRASIFLFLAATGFSGDRWVPHIARVGGDFKNEIRVTNAGSERETFTLAAYTETGGSLGQQSFTLSARESIYLAENHFGDNISHLRLSGSPAVSACVVYTADKLGASPATAAAVTPSESWAFFPGDGIQTWDGLALLNPETRTVTVTVREITETGAVIAVDTLSIGPGDKYVGIGSWSQANSIQIEATRPIAVTALRGTLDGSLLWANDATPTPGLQREKLIESLGIWVFAYAIGGNTYGHAYAVVDIAAARLSSGDLANYGMDENGQLIAGSYDMGLGQLVLLDRDVSYDHLYVYQIEDGVAEGCYYRAYSNGTSSACYDMAAVEVLVKRSLEDDPEIAPVGPLPEAIAVKYRALREHLQSR
jgi:hypothetical protein